MATRWHYLQGITSHEQSPFVFNRDYYVPGADETRILGGYQGRIPNNWQINRLWIEFVTDANVANRYFHMKILTGFDRESLTGNKVEEYTSEAVAANSTFNIVFDRNTWESGTLPSADSHVTIKDLSWLQSGDDCLWLYVNNEQAGDIYSWYIQWQFLNWKLGVFEEIPAARIPRKGWFW